MLYNVVTDKPCNMFASLCFKVVPQAVGERLREAQNINRSLSALADVISAKAPAMCCSVSEELRSPLLGDLYRGLVSFLHFLIHF